MERAGLQDVLKDLELMKQEKTLKVEVDISLEDTLKKVRAVYEKASAPDTYAPTFLSYNGTAEEYVNAVSNLELNPKIIERFSQEIDTSDSGGTKAGLFLSMLIRVAFKQGQNKFTVYTKHMSDKPHYFGSFVYGEQDRWLDIKVIGDLGKHCACLTYVRINVEGKFGAGLFYSPNTSDFRIFGKRVVTEK